MFSHRAVSLGFVAAILVCAGSAYGQSRRGDTESYKRDPHYVEWQRNVRCHAGAAAQDRQTIKAAKLLERRAAAQDRQTIKAASLGGIKVKKSGAIYRVGDARFHELSIGHGNQLFGNLGAMNFLLERGTGRVLSQGFHSFRSDKNGLWGETSSTSVHLMDSRGKLLATPPSELQVKAMFAF